jgi:hypothetical protein
VNIAEYAARCRETCPHTAQGHDGVPCGTELKNAGESYWTFCGMHMAPLLSEIEIDD